MDDLFTTLPELVDMAAKKAIIIHIFTSILPNFVVSIIIVTHNSYEIDAESNVIHTN
jgi:hypothetical protein